MLERVLETEVMDTADEACEYDRMDHQAVNQQFVDDLLHVVRASGGMTAEPLVLDVGTGTARIPIALCRTWSECTVVAADMAVEMLRLARSNVDAAGLHGRILLEQASARRLPSADRSFDVSVSNSLVHHLPDPPTLFAEICRVTVPGGIVFVRDLARPASKADLDRLVQQYAANETPVQRQLFSDSLHASLTVDEIKAMVRPLPLQKLSVRMSSDRHWTLTAVSFG